MKRHFIDLRGTQAPFGNSYGKFLKMRNFNGGGGAAPVTVDPAKKTADTEAFLNQVRELVTNSVSGALDKALEARGEKNKEEINNLISAAFGGVKLEALRELDFTKLAGDVKAINADLAKVKVRGGTPGNLGDKTIQLREAVTAWMDENKDIITRNFQPGYEQKWELQTRAAAIMTTTNVSDKTEIDANVFESFSMAPFVDRRFGRQYVFDIANVSTTVIRDEYKTWLEAGNIEGGFAIVAESTLKPLVSASVVWNKAKVKKVAAKYVITEELEKFKADLLNIIDRMIKDQLVRDYAAFITADLQAESTGYLGTIMDGTITNPNDYQAIAAVAAQIASLNFTPDVLILHPQDLWRIQVATNVNGTFLFPVVTQNGQVTIMGLNIITSTYQTPGTFTVAESGLFKIEQENITMRMGYGVTTVTTAGNVTSVESDFDHNRKRFILEMYFRDWLATPHVGSIVTASFATVKAALEV